MFLFESTLKKLLLVFLMLLPFQSLPKTFISSSGSASRFLQLIGYADEIMLVFSLFVLLSFLLIKPQTYKLIRFPWDVFILLFVVASLISLLVNRVGAFQGIIGTYDVLKNILVIYVFAALRYSKDEFVSIVRTLSRIAFFLAGMGVIASIVALVFPIGVGIIVASQRRMGFYRLISLTGEGNWNYLGIYLVLFLFLGILFFDKKGKKFGFSASMLLALFLTLSRQAWLGLGVVFISLKRKYLSIALIIFIIVGATFILNFSQYEPANYYRSFTLNESLTHFSQNPILGIGPGTFGGVVSVLFESSYYENWPEYFKDYMYRIRSIDLFWPQILAEFGILAFLCYLLVFVLIFIQLGRSAAFFQERDEERMAKIGRIFQFFIFALFVMGFAGGLNSAFVAFTYFALCGMYFSAYIKTKKNESTPSQ